MTYPFPGVSLSIGLVNSVGYTVVVWAIARLFSHILIVLHWVLAGRSALLFYWFSLYIDRTPLGPLLDEIKCFLSMTTSLVLWR